MIAEDVFVLQDSQMEEDEESDDEEDENSDQDETMNGLFL